MYFVLIFFSPLYFVFRKQWGGFVLNAVLWLLAWATIVLLGLGVLFWALAVGHAAWHYRKEIMMEHAVMIAEQMAKQMHK
jgi:uncharacterized membrane protein